MALNFKERWGDGSHCADSVDVAGGTLYVYADSAMFEPPRSPHEDDADVWLSADNLREMREALEWAERRLAAR